MLFSVLYCTNRNGYEISRFYNQLRLPQSANR
jgi:hypothetical protein